MSNTPRIDMPYLVSSQAQKEVTHNEALNILDVFVQTVVESMSLTEPPTTPTEGSLYIPATTATGAWAGKEKHIAQYISGAWVFFAPFEGLTVWLKGLGAYVYNAAGAWEEVTCPAIAHASTHATGGSDELTPDDIGAETSAGAQAKVDAHAEAEIAHDAGQISNTPGGGISATTVQTAINELDSKKAPKIESQHGAKSEFKIIEEEVTLSGAYTDTTTALIPDRAMVFAVTARVTQAITGATSWQLGVSGSSDRYGNGMSPDLGSAVNGISGSPVGYWGDTPVRITAVGGNFTGGKVRVCVHYHIATIPTS